MCIHKLLYYLDLRLPVRCPRCEAWVRKGGTQYVQLTSGKWVFVRTPCYYQLYPDRKSLR